MLTGYFDESGIRKTPLVRLRHGGLFGSSVHMGTIREEWPNTLENAGLSEGNGCCRSSVHTEDDCYGRRTSGSCYDWCHCLSICYLPEVAIEIFQVSQAWHTLALVKASPFGYWSPVPPKFPLFPKFQLNWLLCIHVLNHKVWNCGQQPWLDNHLPKTLIIRRRVAGRAAKYNLASSNEVPLSG